MNILRKMRSFISYSTEFKMLLIEAYLYLGFARFLKTRNFSEIAPTLGVKMEETTYAYDSTTQRTLKNISNAIHLMSRYTFWESQCLVKAIAGMRMLEKRDIASTLYLGTAKDEKGEFIAHAWLRSGRYYLSGSEGMEKFTVVATFAKEVGSTKLEGEHYG